MANTRQVYVISLLNGFYLARSDHRGVRASDNIAEARIFFDENFAYNELDKLSSRPGIDTKATIIPAVLTVVEGTLD